jgi:hypothetical protein
LVPDSSPSLSPIVTRWHKSARNLISRGHLRDGRGGGGFTLPLDAEPILPGEDEVAAALRLLNRVIRDYPRAFDLIQGDALYADPRFFNWAIAHGKYAMAVLKDDRRDLLQDAQRLFEDMSPTSGRDGNCLRECWDLEGFTTWPQVKVPVRVTRSRETRSIRHFLLAGISTKLFAQYGLGFTEP